MRRLGADCAADCAGAETTGLTGKIFGGICLAVCFCGVCAAVGVRSPVQAESEHSTAHSMKRWAAADSPAPRVVFEIPVLTRMLRISIYQLHRAAATEAGRNAYTARGNAGRPPLPRGPK